jgi:Ni/Co efflux regulator RcnB
MNAMHRSRRLLALLLAALIGAAPVHAAPPWAGGGKDGDEKGQKGHKQEHKARKAGDDHGRTGDAGKGKNVARKEPKPGAYFNDRNRDAVRTYYASAGKGGKGCPPGLAKKNNGCLPPGQAKKWNVGQPLPSDVVWYPVPQQIVISLPPVPVGHRYVQVAGDILLIAVGSKMVVDGINGLMSR